MALNAYIKEKWALKYKPLKKIKEDQNKPKLK